MGYDISLSASKLQLFNECPRCFYDAQVLKVPRPRGPFPSLPGGLDRTIKVYLDQHRGSLPPELLGKVPGVLWGTPEKIGRLRHWKSGLKAEIDTPAGRVGVIGALDDLLVCVDGHAPLDAKTKGDTPKDDGAQYYQTALDCYALLLAHNDLVPTGKGYLWYVFPEDCLQGLGAFRFGSTVFELTADANRAVELMGRAAAVLRGTRPEPEPKCEYCRFVMAAAAP